MFEVEEKKNRSFLKGVLAGIAGCLIVLAGGIWCLSVALGITGSDSESGFDLSEVQAKLALIMYEIEDGYLYDIDYDALEEGIYKGMVDALGDAYSEYYTEEEYTELLESSTGEYVGIGVQVMQDEETNLITVYRVYEDAGAYEAGVLAGDIIYEVDGEDITDQDINTVVAKIKGDEGTYVEITVYREQTDEYLTFTIERRTFSDVTVEYELLEDGVGYIQITGFEEATYEQFLEALEDLTAQGMEGLIIDLRDNPGGLLTSVVDIADALLDEGVVVSMEYKDGTGEVYTSESETQFDGELVVIVNGNSASASEVLTGALKDRERAIIVGTTTYGKGIVQSIFSLGDGSGLKITIADYYTPNGTSIHGIGIEPDITVEEGDTNTDDQLEAALEALREQMGD